MNFTLQLIDGYLQLIISQVFLGNVDYDDHHQ